MNFNSLVFPAPKPSYTSDLLGNDLVWIPSYSTFENKNITENRKQINGNGNYKRNPMTTKHEDLMYRITDQPSEEINIEGPIPNYMSPQASIQKKFDFNSYNKKYCNSESVNFFTSKAKNNGNKVTSIALDHSYENYEEKDDDLKPKSIDPYYTRTLDKMNVFTKYSSSKSDNNHRKYKSAALNHHYVTSVPCLLVECPNNPNPEYIVLFFHGNGEDIWLAYELIDSIRQTLKVRVLAPEYPSYGVYAKTECTAEKILQDAENLYNYLINILGYSEDHIIIIGRSIGTGPASFLGAKKKPGAMILISGFTSLQGIVENYAGSMKHLLKERFVNIENMKKIECPTLLIHGMKDKLIPYVHSLKLHDACYGPCELLLPKEMSHFEFDFEEDMSFPILIFLQKWGFALREGIDPHVDRQTPVIFPIEVYFKPNN